MTPQNGPPRIDVWGSCVGRDTLEFMSEFTVGAYVARQSAIVALSPATDAPVPLGVLESSFQRRMLEGDIGANASARIEGSNAVCVLVDLVDERRGVWKFPDATYLTNSVEASRTGIDDWAPKMGARLIEFGTDEHFELWKQGFTLVTRRIMKTRKPIVLLDIAWAGVFEGQPAPKGLLSLLSRATRRAQKIGSQLLRTTKRERSLIAGVAGVGSIPPSVGDLHVTTARDANAKYRRYIVEAEDRTDIAVQRSADDVRMNRAHKWGVAPFHYSDNDYRNIRDSLQRLIRG